MTDAFTDHQSSALFLQALYPGHSRAGTSWIRDPGAYVSRPSEMSSFQEKFVLSLKASVWQTRKAQKLARENRDRQERSERRRLGNASTQASRGEADRGVGKGRVEAKCEGGKCDKEERKLKKQDMQEEQAINECIYSARERNFSHVLYNSTVPFYLFWFV